MFTILVAEDDPQIAGLVQMTLEIAGHQVIVSNDGCCALEQIQGGGFDLALLDIMLPNVSGYELLGALRERSIPGIFVTAKTEVKDRVQGLRLGAEDYIVKPFEPIELLARVETALRRLRPANETLKVGNVSVLPESRTVLLSGGEVPVTPIEYELLEFLLRHKNIAYSREQLLDIIWGYDYYGGTRTVDVHIQRLRSKLDLNHSIKTVHKLGYRLED